MTKQAHQPGTMAEAAIATNDLSVLEHSAELAAGYDYETRVLSDGSVVRVIDDAFVGDRLVAPSQDEVNQYRRNR